ncbi:MAG: hypothetical protein WCC42_05765, partial [Pseudolabrys sp.]
FHCSSPIGDNPKAASVSAETSIVDGAYVRFGSLADMCSAQAYVRSVPEADIAHRYSITSSARRTVKPSEPSQLGLIVPI